MFCQRGVMRNTALKEQKRKVKIDTLLLWERGGGREETEKEREQGGDGPQV